MIRCWQRERGFASLDRGSSLRIDTGIMGLERAFCQTRPFAACSQLKINRAITAPKAKPTIEARTRIT